AHHAARQPAYLGRAAFPGPDRTPDHALGHHAEHRRAAGGPWRLHRAPDHRRQDLYATVQGAEGSSHRCPPRGPANLHGHAVARPRAAHADLRDGQPDGNLAQADRGPHQGFRLHAKRRRVAKAQQRHPAGGTPTGVARVHAERRQAVPHRLQGVHEHGVAERRRGRWRRGCRRRCRLQADRHADPGIAGTRGGLGEGTGRLRASGKSHPARLQPELGRRSQANHGQAPVKRHPVRAGQPPVRTGKPPARIGRSIRVGNETQSAIPGDMPGASPPRQLSCLIGLWKVSHCGRPYAPCCMTFFRLCTGMDAASLQESQGEQTMSRVPRAVHLSLPAALALGVAVSLPSNAQRAPGPDAVQPTTTVPALQFHYMGAAPHGRIASAVGIPGNYSTYYLGAASGGLWKSTDGGHTYKPIFDQQNVAAIGTLAIPATDPNTIWVGTGEPWLIRPADVIGNGVYKSTDAGETWQHMGLVETGRIARIVVNPRDANNVFVCAIGRASSPQQERGVFRSTDGGKTWKRTLFVNPDTGCSGLTMDPGN